MTDAPLLAPRRPHGPTDEAARRLQHKAGELTRQVLTDPHLGEHDDARRAATVPADLAAWLAVLTEELTEEQVAALFRVRAAAHHAAGLRCEEALVQQQVCVSTLSRAVADTSGKTTGTTGERAGGPGTTAAARLGPHMLAIAVTAVVEYYAGRNEAAGKQHEAARNEPGPDEPTRKEPVPGEPARSEAACLVPAPARPVDAVPDTPAGPALPPHWCLAVAQLGADGAAALRTFRAANPQARIAVTGAHLTAFTHQRPRSPDVFGPYALVPVENGDLAGAARRAALAAVIARHYGQQVDGERALPLVAALDLDREQREAYVASCLGQLHTTDRYPHLLQTLSVYLAHNQCVNAAARALYIHRHTLTYRLRAIRDLTGLDLSSPLDRMRAELALILSRATPWSLPPERRR